MNQLKECKLCSTLFEIVHRGQRNYCSYKCRVTFNDKAWHRKRYITSDKGKATREASRLRNRYGITMEDYKLMLEDQDFRCAICFGETSGRGKLHVDHSHKTQKVRGLLCSRCNQGLGMFSENTESLQRAIEYLNTFDEQYYPSGYLERTGQKVGVPTDANEQIRTD